MDQQPARSSQQHGAGPGAGAGASDASPHAVVVHVAPSYAASSAPASSHDASSSSSVTMKQVASFAAMDDPASPPPPAYEEYKSDPPVVERAPSAEAAPAYSPDPASPWAAAAALAAPAAPPDEPPMDLEALERNLRYPLLRPNEHGELFLQSRPSCLMIFYMLPLPVWSMGCCISQSNDILFDDVARTIRIVSWPGAFCCDCCKKTRVLRYAEIVNVVAVPHDLQIGGQPSSVIHLQIAGGERVRISDPLVRPDMWRRAFAIHRFLFGRANPRAYRQPEIDELFTE